MDITNRRNMVTVKKLDMNSPDFYKENMCLTEGTPKECWEAFWSFMSATSVFLRDNDFNKPLRRDVARKTSWAEIMKEGEKAWAH